MAFSIEEFKGAINRQVARPNRFRATISHSKLNPFGSRQLSFLCEATELPGRQFDTTPELMYGVARKMPFGTLYADLNLTFICTSLMEERYFFDRWMSYVSDPTSNYMHYYDDYAGTIILDQFSVEGRIAYTCYVEEAYPIAVLPQPLAYSDENSYMRLTVTFAYRRWRNDYEKRIGDAATQGFGFKEHISPTNEPSQGFPGEWRAPEQLESQTNYDQWFTIGGDPHGGDHAPDNHTMGEHAVPTDTHDSPAVAEHSGTNAAPVTAEEHDNHE